ncbi:MAG: CoA transferase [Deltaproteobacteria bacterium]|nr:CoA transferase [Deltaproteobacteria bacterium]
MESILEEAGLPFGRVKSLEDLFVDPHLKVRDRFIDYDYLGKTFPMIAPFPLLSKTPGSARTLQPAVGQHNEEIYHQLLGLPLEKLDSLKTEGVI